MFPYKNDHMPEQLSRHVHVENDPARRSPHKLSETSKTAQSINYLEKTVYIIDIRRDITTELDNKYL
jgi:hypothetical protein